MYFVSTHIHPSEGGGFYFAPGADPGDGKLAICVASHSSKLRLVPMLFRARLPRFVKRKGVRIYECREAKIHMDRPVAVPAQTGRAASSRMIWKFSVLKEKSE